MKILRRIKVRGNKIFAYFSLFSMLANTLSPFAAMIPSLAYAEDTTAPVEVIVEEKEPAEEQKTTTEATLEETADGQDLTIEEEKGNEITEETNTDVPEEPVEEPADEVVDPEAPDIIVGGGASTINVIAEIEDEETLEVTEIPTPVEEPEAEIKEYETLADGVEIKDSVEEDWELDEKGFYETKEKVKIGIKYVFPENEKVSVTFKKLPVLDEYRSTLRIKEVNSEDLPEELRNSDVYAVDITTDMNDGEFEYDLTLPKAENSKASVSYMEDLDSEVKNVEEGDVKQEDGEDSLKVEDIDHMTVFVVTGSVGPIIDPSANPANAGFYLRYVGNPAPDNYSHNYQWKNPFYVCNPNEEEVIFTGDIDISKMSVGGVAFIGLLDKGLLELGKDGYQSGAYAYIYRISNSKLRVGPTDGNIGGEIVQVFKDYDITGKDSLKLKIKIHKPNVSVQVEGDDPITDTYGDVKTLNNTTPYTWNEFEFGAIPGWDNFGSADMPYLFKIDGCREISTDKVKICHATSSDTNPYIVNNPNKSGDLNGHADHTGGVFPDDLWGDIIPPFTYFECPTSPDYYSSSDSSLSCKMRVEIDGGGEDWIYAEKLGLSFPGLNWVNNLAGQAIYNNNCEIPTEGYCGDGNVDENLNEQCDDGNIINGDGCSSTCLLEGPVGRCGDGNVNAENEQCDDGNENDEDYCDNNCQFNNVCLTGVNMLVNGAFEKPEVNNDYKWDIFDKYSPMLGWAIEWSGGSGTYNSETRPEPALLELHRGVNGWSPKSGNQYAELDTDWDGPGQPLNNEPASVKLSQKIPVLDGYKYKVEFSYSPRPGHENNSMDFELGESVVENYPVSGVGNTTTNWTSKSHEFVADADAVKKVSFVEKGTADSLGMFIDDVSVYCLGREIPECVEEGPVWADEVGSVVTGTLYNENEIVDSIRIDPEEALGQADGDFYSLGERGEIILNFYYYIANVPGDDLSIHEITWNRLADIEEKAKVWVKNDNTGWIYLGEASSFADGDNDNARDGINYFDLSDIGLSWINSVKLVESSTDQLGNDDGFDLDAVDATQRVCKEPVVECGDGVINQTFEECDGLDGITEDLNFCTPTCKLIPIYDGGHSCAPGTTPVKVGEYTVDSTDSDGITFGVNSGQEYLFKVLGTYNYDIHNTGKYADGAYGTSNNWTTTRDDIGIWGTNMGVISLLGDLGGGVGVIEWDDDETFNSSHIYQKVYTPDADNIQFLISDWYDGWYSNSCDSQSCMRDNSGNLKLEVYECQPFEDITVCKEDEEGELLEGWDILLASEEVYGPTLINVSNGTGTNSESLPAGKYLIKVTGTYKYGSSEMIADAGYSYRPNGIPSGCDCWLSGFDLPSGTGLMVRVNNTTTNWGFYNDAHEYLYIYDHSGGPINLSVLDDYYTDNVNQNFEFSIYELLKEGTTGGEGCVEFKSVPHGSYYLDEMLKEYFVRQSGTGSIEVNNEFTSFTIVNDYETRRTTINGFKWEDQNQDSEWDGGEPGLQGWDIYAALKVDEFYVPAKDTPSIDSIALELGKDYIIRAAGTYDANDGITADAKYSVRNPNTNWTDSVQNYESYGETLLDLQVDGNSTTCDWGEHSEDHTYFCKIPGDGNTHSFEIYDLGNGSNNSGNLSVEIFEVIDSTVTDIDGAYSLVVETDAFEQIYVLEGTQENYVQTTPMPEGYYQVEAGADTDGLNFGNFKTTYGIHGYKWNDSFLDGVRGKQDEGEDHLPGWTINLYRWVDEAFETGPFKTTLTSSEPGDDFGWYWFEDLLPGRYKICEVQQNGWEQTFPVNESGNCHIVDLPDINPNGYLVEENSLPEPEPTYNFGNEFISPSASIAKWNDSSEPEEVGNEVMFTIRVTAHDNDVVGAYVFDLFSEGFEYIDGSWTAESSDGRDLKALGITFEPEYASPASWYLGEIEEGEEVTLTYLARVTDQVDPGIYKDLAWTQGEDLLGGEVLGYAESEGYIDDDTFVGTEVEVVVENEIEDEVDVKEEEIGEVLGASTELPATGASTFWVNLMLVLASIGGLLLLVGGFGTMSTKKQKTIKKGKKAILGLVTLGFFTLFSFKVYAAPIVVRLSEPESPVGGEFDLVFVAMDIADNDMEATCEVKKPGSASFTPFGSLITISAGDSGDSRTCAVTDSVLDDDGEYKFRVVVDPGDVSSNEVTVDYDGDGPDRPKYIEKEKVNNCVNKITLKTADDDETTSVQIFADDDKEIDIDDSHKIETESIGPDEKFDFEHIVSGDDCDKTWYYAVVAFDDAGNASKPRSEVITTTTTTTEEGEEEETGAIPVEGGAGIVEGGATTGGEDTEGTEGEEGEGALEVDFGEGEEGSVLGEETAKEGKTLFKSPWFWIVSAGLGILIISATRKKKA